MAPLLLGCNGRFQLRLGQFGCWSIRWFGRRRVLTYLWAYTRESRFDHQRVRRHAQLAQGLRMTGQATKALDVFLALGFCVPVVVVLQHSQPLKIFQFRRSLAFLEALWIVLALLRDF